VVQQALELHRRAVPHAGYPRALSWSAAPAIWPTSRSRACDIEAWSPRQKKYFEVGSCSNLGDAQARRLSIRYRDENGKLALANTLNNTCVAPPRMLIAFLENHLQRDGSVTIPACLQPYMGGKRRRSARSRRLLSATCSCRSSAGSSAASI
jgi:hypothetical protein